MASIELRFSWRTWLRVVVCAFVSLLLGIVALTPDAPWWLRIVFGIAGAIGIATTVDALIFARSWRVTEQAMHVPTLLSRKREISGDGLTVELTPGRRPTVRVTGKRGSRLVGSNPLVAGADLRRWFGDLPADDAANGEPDG